MPTTLIPLSEVFVAVDSESSLSLFKSAITDVVSTFASSNKRIALDKFYDLTINRQNISFLVTACSPVLAGVLTPSTKLIALVDPLRIRAAKEAKTLVKLSGNSSEQVLASVEEMLFSPVCWDISLGKTLPAVTLQATVLDKQINLNANEPIDEDSLVVLGSKCAISLGVLHNDFVFIGSNESNRRICRVYISDTICPDSSVCRLSPSSYFNLDLKSEANVSAQRISPTFTQTDIPRATQLTVSRISGPFTSNRKYLDLCLDALKDWFLQSNRIVSEGDVIHVPINELAASLRNEYYCDEDLDIRDDIGFRTNAWKAVAFFKITAISSNRDQQIDKSFMSRIIDANTRIIESGVISSSVPKGVNSYFEIETPTWPENSDSHSAHSSLNEILSTFFHPMSLSLGLESSIFMAAPHGSGKISLIRSVVDFLGVNLLQVDCFSLNLETGASSAFATLDVHFEKALTMEPCVFVLKNLDALVGGGASTDQKEQSALSNLLVEFLKAKREQCTGSQLALIATTADPDKVPKDVQSFFRNEIIVEAASDDLRNRIVQNLTRGVSLSNDIDRKKLTIQTAGLVPADLVSLIARALSITVDAVLPITTEHAIHEMDIAKAGLVISSASFEKALSFTKKTQADTIGAPSIPNVTWDDIGGLAHIRNSINDTIQLPLERPELFASGMKKRSGILLFGPPGTGKTLIAKAVATTFSLNFLSVKGPELLNMYIGESEANVRRIFQQARNAKPCVIFFDELDSVAPKRGDKGDSSGGVMDRIVSQLLAELDNVGSSGGDVFVIGATNRPDLLDSALLRPGRFDKMLYLGVSEEKQKQVSVMQALTRKFILDPELRLERVAEKAPPHLTGADLYALCSDAMLKAMSRTIRVVDEKILEHNEMRTKEGKPLLSMTDYLETAVDPKYKSVVVNEKDFLVALEELKPSLTPADLAHYAELQGKFK
ncbi:P-loop containing nucleoside triphosphate hydrolase protein [Chytriomyces cf. hyalinus JEL632]|nr:P-loop containing nucleoside triphosphate hydrolase protein [Chytriomyces cf. hyalinus JEL632]